MKKYFIDTSVILDSPTHLEHIFQNGDNELYISDIILKELNGLKEDAISEKGYFAREFIRALDLGKPIQKSVSIFNNDTVQSFECVCSSGNKIEISIISREKYKAIDGINDQKILEIAKDYRCVLLTNDIALKIISLSKKVPAESIRKTMVKKPEEITFLHTFTYEGEESLIKFMLLDNDNIKNYDQVELTEEKTGQKKYYLKTNNHFLEITDDLFKRNRIKPINIEQKFYSAMLKEPFSIITVTGSTGSGKTLMSLVEGLNMIKDPSNPIDGIVYLRNTVTANDKASELGFRKGSEEQKLGYFAYALKGALRFILENSFSEERGELKKIDEQDINKFMLDNNIELLDIAHARGITISNKLIIFDELQNASLETLKLIGTRVGKGSRLLLMGDFKQVDHPYLTKNRNALVSMLKLAQEEDYVGAIQLTKTIRSEIANFFQEKI